MKRFYLENVQIKIKRKDHSFFLEITSGKDVYLTQMYRGTMLKCDTLPMRHCLGISTPDGEQFTLRKRKGRIVLTDHTTGVDLDLDRSIAK
jgi:hypothetical protein